MNMNKVRSDAHWHQLSAEQLETLDHWLFEEHLSYGEVVTKAEQELGYKTSYSSLRRYYQRRSQERAVEDLAERVTDAAEVKATAGNAELLRQATMKLLAAQAFQQVRETPADAAKWGPAVKMMLQHERNETVREGQRIRQQLREEDQAIRRETTEFYRQKFQLDTVDRAVRALPELQRLAAAINDPDTSRYSNNPHWNEAREKMFEGGMEDIPRPTLKAGQGGNGAEGKTPNTKHQTPEKLQTPIQMTKDKTVMTKECRMTKDEVNEPIAELGKHRTSNIEHPTPNETMKKANEVDCPPSVVSCDLPKAEVEAPVAVPAPAPRKFSADGTSHDGTFRIVGRDKTG
jgi:hypothetical protein